MDARIEPAALRTSDDWGGQAGRGKPALWPIAVTVALLASGFSRRPRNDAHRDDTQDAPRGGWAEREAGSGSGRGRSAATPSQIPVRGWKDILLRVYDNISEHRVIAIAAGVTFYTILAIFPAIAALVALYGLFADPGTIANHLKTLSSFVPGGAIDVVGEQLGRVASQGNRTLGFTFAFSLLVSLWSANAGMKAIFDALNIVYAEREKRGFIKLNAISLAFTVGALVLVSLAIGAMIILPIALGYVGLGSATEWILTLGRWPLLLIAISLGIALIYRYGPSRSEPQWHWISWGSAFAAIGWLIVSLLFSWYAQNFGNYNKTYGSLGAVIGFMTWIWLSSIVILIGAELNAEMEHQTARDTTTGHPKPLGTRGARMADTIGAARG
jgi:membrane protein